MYTLCFLNSKTALQNTGKALQMQYNMCIKTISISNKQNSENKLQNSEFIRAGHHLAFFFNLLSARFSKLRIYLLIAMPQISTKDSCQSGRKSGKACKPTAADRLVGICLWRKKAGGARKDFLLLVTIHI